MAKTIDELTLKVNVDGAATLDTLNTKLGNIDQSTKSASESLKQFNVRNVAYQIQDLAVQLSMGTNAFMAIGQQLPQLLSGFGVMGAVIGAVAAVAIPLLQKGLEAAGVDMRNLSEMTKDLSDTTARYIEAQKANQSTLAGMGNSYGALTDEAKKFYQVQEELLKLKTQRETVDTVKELSDSYSFATGNVSKLGAAVDKLTGGQFKGGIFGDIVRVQAWWLGISAEQAEELSKKFKQLDANSPEKTVDAVNDILKYLLAAGPEADNFRRQFEKNVEPLLKVNEQLIKSKTNIKEAAEQATKFQAALLDIQNKYQPSISDARRNFDQITAIEIEAKQKAETIKANFADKFKKDQVNRSKEEGAALLQVEQERSAKVADFVKGQEEAFRSSSMAADAKLRQLGYEEKITALNQEGKLAALDAYQYNSQVINLQKDYENELITVGEQLRKNQITQQQAAALEQKALEVRNKGFSAAYDQMDARQKAYIQSLQRANELDQRKLEAFNKNATLSDRERKNAEQIFSIETDRLNQLKGIQSISDPGERARREKEINDIFAQRIEQTKKQQQADSDLAANFESGWKRAYANYVDDSKNAFDQAKRMFDKTMSGMEDVLVNFAKTGKFEWKSFVASMMEELLRSNIKQMLGNIFSPTSAMGSGLSGILGTLGGFGGATKGASATDPMYVLDVSKGGLGGGASGATAGIFGNQGSQGGIVGSIKNAFSGISNTVGSVFSGVGNAIGGIADSVGSIFSGGGSSGGGSFLGDMASSIGNFFGGFFANGGPIPAGKFGVVGERGPELIGGPANITPMAGSVTYNINAVDAMSFKQMIAADPSFLYAVTQQGAKSIPGRF